MLRLRRISDVCIKGNDSWRNVAIARYRKPDDWQRKWITGGVEHAQDWPHTTRWNRASDLWNLRKSSGDLYPHLCVLSLSLSRSLALLFLCVSLSHTHRDTRTHTHTSFALPLARSLAPSLRPPRSVHFFLEMFILLHEYASKICLMCHVEYLENPYREHMIAEKGKPNDNFGPP
jgi:hypothetical protein